jgi:hypothetical protein
MFVDGVVIIIVMCGIISYGLSCNNNNNTHCFELVLFYYKFSTHICIKSLLMIPIYRCTNVGLIGFLFFPLFVWFSFFLNNA